MKAGQAVTAATRYPDRRAERREEHRGERREETEEQRGDRRAERREETGEQRGYFFRPTPSWLPPGRYTHSIAANC